MDADWQPQVTLIIPCYNEADRLPAGTIDSFARENAAWLRFILVDDGSRDATASLIDGMAKNNSRIQALHLAVNQGKAEAVRQGMLAGLDEPAELLGFWDADMATPLTEVMHLMDNMRRGDFEAVLGCRLARLGSQVKRRKARHYLGRVFATTVSSLLYIPLYDSQCGAKIFRRYLAQKVFARPFISRWLFDVEIFRRIVRLYGREKTMRTVYECPLYQWEDVGGSKLTLFKMLQTPFELWKIFRSGD